MKGIDAEMKLAQIILNHKSAMVDKPFTYEVEEDLSTDIKVGMRVVVPFGIHNTPTKGIIIQLEEANEKFDFKLKKIIHILDDKPIINQEMIDIAHRIKEKYLCSFNEALHPFIPPGDYRNLETTIEIVDTPGIETDNLNKLELNIIDILNKNKKMTLDRLIEILGITSIQRELTNLEGKGYIKSDLNIKSKPSRKVERYYLKTKSISYEEGVELIGNRAKKQQEVWDYIRDKKEGILKDILQELNISTVSLKGLVEKGLITIINKDVEDEILAKNIHIYKKIQLNEEQKAVFDGIINSNDKVFLIHGVTGSGKTEVYLQMVEQYLEEGKDSIILVPEISLTPQTIDRFVGRFGQKVAILHSRLTLNQRFEQWRKIRSGEYKIVVGARSAIFAPFKNLGLIIIDEEHENSYKSGQNPKYVTSEIAKMRIENNKGKLVLGTATPTIETYYKSVIGEYTLFSMKNRATSMEVPEIKVIDMREELKNGNKSIFSNDLYQSILERLDKKEQIVLFLNRRGYSGFVTCRSCGYVSKCDSCDVSMTMHKSNNRMVCHYCGRSEEIPVICPICNSKYIKYFGIGTEKVEEEVVRLFPKARVARMDSDTIRKIQDYDRILGQMKSKDIDILIGTQMISKGLDFPSVTLVGIIAADTTLNLPDFRSAEKTFQLTTQVAGRAGRGNVEGNVYLQTYNPEHFSIQYAKDNNYQGFFHEELKLRREFGYPPFLNLIVITIFGPSLKKCMDISELVYNRIASESKQIKGELSIIKPNLAPIEKISGNYRMQIVLKIGYNIEDEIKDIIKRVIILNEGKIDTEGVKFSIDIDPSNLL